eukprot:s4014_g7.t1
MGLADARGIFTCFKAFESVANICNQFSDEASAACTENTEGTNSKSSSKTDPCTGSPKSRRRLTASASSILETQYVDATPSTARAAPWLGSNVELAETEAEAAALTVDRSTTWPDLADTHVALRHLDLTVPLQLPLRHADSCVARHQR